MRTPTDAKEARRKEPDCQPGCAEKGSGTGTRAFPDGVENGLERGRGPRGGGDRSPEVRGPEPRGTHPSSARALRT